MTDMRDLLLTLTVACILALVGFGIWGLRQRGPKLKPALMIVAGVVLLFNLWLYLLPPPQ